MGVLAHAIPAQAQPLSKNASSLALVRSVEWSDQSIEPINQILAAEKAKLLGTSIDDVQLNQLLEQLTQDVRAGALSLWA